jgi:hypothetical protein
MQQAGLKGRRYSFMFSVPGQGAVALFIALQAATAPPRAEPFDCSWIYHPPTGERERFEGVYTSFIDNGGFYACSTSAACRDWSGKKNVEIDFSEPALEQLHRRAAGYYGVYKIVFEGRRGKLEDRPGCEANEWSLEAWGDDYVRVEKVLSVRPFKDNKR